MSFKHKLFSIFTLAFAFVAFGTFVSAQDTTEKSTDGVQKQRKFEGRGYGRGMRGGKRGDKSMIRGLERLNLTDAQKQQIKTLFDVEKATTQTQREEMRALFMKKRNGETLTETEQARMGELKQQLKANAEQTRNSVLAILTAEQRQQLEQIKEERRQRREQRRQNRQQQTTTDTIN